MLKPIFRFCKKIFNDCSRTLNCRLQKIAHASFNRFYLNDIGLVALEAYVVGVYEAVSHFVPILINHVNPARFQFYGCATIALGSLYKGAEVFDKYLSKFYIPLRLDLGSFKYHSPNERQSMKSLRERFEVLQKQGEIIKSCRKACQWIKSFVEVAIKAITWGSAALENETIRKAVTIENNDFEKIMRNNAAPIMLAATVASYVGLYALELRQKQQNNQAQRGR